MNIAIHVPNTPIPIQSAITYDKPILHANITAKLMYITDFESPAPLNVDGNVKANGQIIIAKIPCQITISVVIAAVWADKL